MQLVEQCLPLATVSILTRTQYRGDRLQGEGGVIEWRGASVQDVVGMGAGISDGIGGLP